MSKVIFKTFEIFRLYMSALIKFDVPRISITLRKKILEKYERIVILLPNPDTM